MKTNNNKTEGVTPKCLYIKTFGCQMNVSDSELMRSILASKGWKITDTEKDADVVLLNTCSVRDLAEKKVWSKLGELSKLKAKSEKRKDKELIIGVTGCMAQNYGEKIFDRAPYVNLICGSYRFSKIDELLNKAASGTTHVLDIERKDEISPRTPRHFKKIKVTSFVPIMRGCNNKCTYCVVPYVRGPERSRGLKEIIDEVSELAKSGYKEVTLLGQNVNSYRSSNQKLVNSNQKDCIDFVELLRQVNKIDGIERIRFVTSHPKDASSELFEAISELDKVCEYLHLPIQSGSNKILKKMNREYTREHYLKLTETLHDVSLTTDIIVGFPGETERDFQDTLELMKKVEFDSAFVFKYSPRIGTAAAKFTDSVPLSIKKERNNQLLQLQDEISLKKNKKLIGTEQEVLVEGVSKNNKDRLMGRTRTNKIVIFKGVNDLIGQLLKVKIVDVTAHTLYGLSLRLDLA